MPLKVGDMDTFEGIFTVRDAELFTGFLVMKGVII